MTETELERMVVRLMGDASDYMKMLETSKRETKKSMREIGQQIRSFGIQLSAAITAPLAGLSYKARKEFSSFETSLSSMIGLVGLSEETVAGLKREILELAPAVGKGPSELGQAMFFITSAGLRGEKALEALNASARAAAAGLGNTTGVADAVTSAMNAYGHETLGATRATEILTAAVRTGKAEAASFAPQFGQLLPLASSMNISFEQVAGSMAFLTKTTGNASLAATGLKGAFRILMGSSQEAVKALEEVGIPLTHLQETARQRGINEAFMELKTRLAAQGKELRHVIKDCEALSAVLQMTGPAAEDYANVLKEVANSAGMVDEAFNAASKTSRQQWNVAMAEMKVALVELGEIMAPIVQELTGWGMSLANVWKELSYETKQWLVVAGAIAATLGPALLFIGQLSMGLAAVSTAASMATTALTYMGTVMTFLSAHPFLIAFVALEAGIVAAYLAARKFNQVFKEQTEIVQSHAQAMQSMTQRHDEMIQDLQKLAQKQNLSNEETARARKEIRALEQIYGELNVKIDETGVHFEDMSKSLKVVSEAQRQLRIVNLYQEITDAEKEFAAATEAANQQLKNESNAFRPLSNLYDMLTNKQEKAREEAQKWQDTLLALHSELSELETAKVMAEFEPVNISRELLPKLEPLPIEIKPMLGEGFVGKTPDWLGENFMKGLEAIGYSALQAKQGIQSAEEAVLKFNAEFVTMSARLTQATFWTNQYKTEQEKLAEQLKELDNLHSILGESFSETYRRATKDINEQLDKLKDKDVDINFRVHGVDALEAGSLAAAKALEEYRTRSSITAPEVENVDEMAVHVPVNTAPLGIEQGKDIVTELKELVKIGHEQLAKTGFEVEPLGLEDY